MSFLDVPCLTLIVMLRVFSRDMLFTLHVHPFSALASMNWKDSEHLFRTTNWKLGGVLNSSSLPYPGH